MILSQFLLRIFIAVMFLVRASDGFAISHGPLLPSLRRSGGQPCPIVCHEGKRSNSDETLAEPHEDRRNFVKAALVTCGGLQNFIGRGQVSSANAVGLGETFASYGGWELLKDGSVIGRLKRCGSSYCVSYLVDGSLFTVRFTLTRDLPRPTLAAYLRARPTAPPCQLATLGCVHVPRPLSEQCIRCCRVWLTPAAPSSRSPVPALSSGVATGGRAGKVAYPTRTRSSRGMSVTAQPRGYQSTAATNAVSTFCRAALWSCLFISTWLRCVRRQKVTLACNPGRRAEFDGAPPRYGCRPL